MAGTRKSTGSLPAPKRKSLAESDIDEDGFSDESVVERPAKKRVKKAQASVKRGGADGDDDNAVDSNMAKKSKKGKLDAREDEPDAVASTSTDVVKKKSERMDSLITGPESKNFKTFSKGNPPLIKKLQMKKGDVGKLARMVDLPVEIFCKIASYLKPKNLLLLSRSSRIMRDLLMSKSSRSIWIVSEAATGMPPCPSDMSEPQYANLYFEKDCHACGYPRVDKLTDHLRIRLCKGCHKLNVVKGSSVIKEIFGQEASKMYEIYSLLPWNNMYEDDSSRNRVDSKVHNRYFLKYDFIKVVRTYLETKPDSEERKNFVKKRHQLVNEIVKNIKDVASWRGGLRWKRPFIEDKIRAKRRLQIFAKLRGLGYEEEELEETKYMESQLWNAWKQLVNQPRDLTDRSWALIKKPLQNLLLKKREIEHEREIEKNRVLRKGELLNLYMKYVEKHGWRDRTNQAPLCFGDLWEAPVVSQIVNQNECEDVLTEERWKPIEEKLPAMAEEHARRVEQDCAARIHSACQALYTSGDQKEDYDGNSSIIWRANAIFCWRSFFDLFSLTASPFSFADLIQRRIKEITSVQPWNADSIGSNGPIIKTADALLTSMGLSDDTSMEHMASLGQTFVCQRCDPVLREPMTWIELAKHMDSEYYTYSRMERRFPKPDAIPFLNDHDIKAPIPLAAIDPNFIKAPLESFTLFGPANERGNIVKRSCTYCRRLDITKVFLYKELLAAHTRSRHGVEDTIGTAMPVMTSDSESDSMG